MGLDGIQQSQPEGRVYVEAEDLSMAGQVFDIRIAGQVSNWICGRMYRPDGVTMFVVSQDAAITVTLRVC
jgi:hypothetical protein